MEGNFFYVPAPITRKHSSLTSASLPFCPSGSSNKDITLSKKRKCRVQAQARIFALLPNSALVRGKNIADSVTIDKLCIDGTVTPPTAGKPLSNMKMPPSVSSVVSSIPSSQSRAQGRIVAMSGQMTYQGAPQHDQINRTSPTPPLHSLQRIPAQNRSQPPAQQLVQCPGSDSQASSPPKIQGNRRGSFLYGGTQVMGAGHGDQNFPGTTFFLASYAIWWSASRWSWSSCGCHGVSRICCSAEMTWLPVLTGAAGALGLHIVHLIFQLMEGETLGT